MTIKELKTATAGLGFEDDLDSSSRFYSAANRALYAANRIRPRENICKIEHIADGERSPDVYINGEGYTLYTLECEDFLCFAPSPVSKDGRILISGEDYYFEGEKTFMFKAEESGEYRIRYFRTLEPISEDDEDAKIDLPEDVCRILPLLVASYVWLDDEEEKSAVYRNLFYSEASQIRAFGASGENASFKYHLDGGWEG